MSPPAASPTFVGFLDQVEDGDLARDLSEQLRQLVESMHRQADIAGGKPKGKLTVVVDLKLEGGVFEVRADVKVTAPKAPRQRSIFYRHPDNGLSANNPKQLDLGMDAREVRDVAAAAPRGELRALP